MMSRAALATLASEIEQARPTPEWDSIPELKKFRQEVEFISKDGSKNKKKLTFDQMVVQCKTYSAEIDYRQDKIKELKEALETALMLGDVEEVECEGYPVHRITKKGSRKIVAEKLLAHGVDAHTIAECTEIGPTISYIQIGRAKRD